MFAIKTLFDMEIFLDMIKKSTWYTMYFISDYSFSGILFRMAVNCCQNNSTDFISTFSSGE